MSDGLQNWLEGGPLVTAGAKSGGFSHWLGGAPLISNLVGDIIVFENVVVFTGEVVRVGVKGKIVSARGQAGGSVFDRQVPRFRLQTGCNHTLFDTGCGLAKAAWKFTAKIGDPGDPGYPFEFELTDLARVSGPAPAFFEHWFAGGWIELGAGPTWRRLPILRASNVSAGTLTVTLSRDPDPFPEEGEDVVLYPGCDGRWETCGAYHGTNNPQGKFDNRLNFGGHPFVPVANPSLVKVSESVAGGKKS